MNLQPFCGIRSINIFKEPWTDGEWTYAASNICAVRVPKTGDYPERHEKRLPELFKIFPTTDEWMPWPKPVFNVAANTCAACINGEVIGEGNYKTCPICDDTMHDPFLECSVGGTSMNPWMAHLIGRLRDVQIFTGIVDRGGSPLPPTAFRFRDGQGLLMPIKIRQSIPDDYAERLLAATPGTIFINLDGKEICEIPKGL